MRFLVPFRFKEDVKTWINLRHVYRKRSNWFPFYKMSDGAEALMANIVIEDALAFALTFEHERMDNT